MSEHRMQMKPPVIEPVISLDQAMRILSGEIEENARLRQRVKELEALIEEYLEAKYACDKRENCWPDNTPFDEVRREYHAAERRLREALKAEGESDD